MRQPWVQGLLAIAMLGAGAPAVLAADQGGQSMEHKATSASAATAQTPSSSTPMASTQPVAAPPSSASTSSQASVIMKPTMLEGSVTALDLTSTPPSLKLTAADGHVWTFTLDAKATTVWRSGLGGTLDQLKVGEQVTVRYMTQDGKAIAQAIRIVQQARKATSSAPSSTASY